jgi:CubicO group peptidase (beta-lactamase class C family)
VNTISRRDVSRTVTAGVLTIAILLLSFGGLSPSHGDERRQPRRGLHPPTYDAAISEGRAAARDDVRDAKASAITIALVDRGGIVWSEAFGLADRRAGQAATPRTMFGIGSLGKLFATVATLKLVDRGLVDLDRPLVEYVPDFRMASPEYTQITVRMLLNHSAGFPGTDYRNGETAAPVPGYLDQVLQSLSSERLKTPPGYMSVYCNDCFTMTEALIRAVTGKSYAQFVQDEILTPLGMENTRFPFAPFPDGSYAKTYGGDGAVQPQLFANPLATGGLYSTPSDMARLAMMFLGNGAVGALRVVSRASVVSMAVDTTPGTFNPVRNQAHAWGLGWDSVAEPGLGAVGFDSWMKGGDVTGYGSAIIVSPRAQLAAVVIVASGSGSGHANAIAQRVLLRALAENRLIRAFPSPLPAVVPPVQAVPDSVLAAIAGQYATFNLIFRIEPQPDGSFRVFILSEDGWSSAGEPHPFKYRGDGWFSTDENPRKSMKVIDAGGTRYLVVRQPDGYQHYLNDEVFAQQVRGEGGLSAAWRARLSRTWLLVNESPDSLSKEPRLRLATAPEIDGLVAVRPTNDAGFFVVDPSASDAVARMMLVAPQLAGRDLNDLEILVRDGVEWTRFGSYVHRPLEGVPVLPGDATTTVAIGPDGYAEWRAVTIPAKPVEVRIDTTGAWRIYDATFTPVASGKGSSRAVLPAANVESSRAYLVLFGDPGQLITVTVSEEHTDRTVFDALLSRSAR